MIVLLLLASCGSADSAATDGDSQEKIFELTMSSGTPQQTDPSQSEHYPSTWFAEEVEKRSDGRIKINVHYSNSLVPVDVLLDAMKQGTVDFAYTGMQNYGDTIPEGFMGLLPYWTRGPEQSLEIMNETEIGEILHDRYTEHGAMPLSHTVKGAWGFMLNKKITKIEDLKGVLVNSNNGITTSWFKELGIVGADIPVPDLYDALQRGIIDGVGSSYIGLENMNWGEVVDYVITPPYINGNFVTTFISTKTWEKLPEDLQNIILEVSEEVETIALEKTMEVESEENMSKMYEKFDVEEIVLSEEEQEKLIKSTEGIWDEFATMSENNAKMVEILREFHKEND